MVSSFQVDGKGLRSCGKSWTCKSTANNDRSAENKAASPVHERGWTCQIPTPFSLGWKSERDEQQREARIFSDAGRILRPLIVIKNLDKIKAFKGGNYIFASLRDKGIIEFIGTEEEEDCCTAWGIRFFFKDIAGKQSMNVTKARVVNGQNAIVAVNVHLGYNQEDALVMKCASLGRSMFRFEHIRSYKAEVDNKELTDKRRKSEDSITFGKIQSKIGRVDNLDDDGFSFIGANMQCGDIMIGKCAESGTDHRVKLKHTERGMVQKVVLSSNDERKNFTVVSWRQNLWLADANGTGFLWVDALGSISLSWRQVSQACMDKKGVLGFLESQ
ncbi:DNA-DIRECTED RNA polymerase I SUBUNIT 2 [Salix viminalis]|uniref:DNA-directed RNA polymerase n=1 Tax=Salix viminalis TaxID=40686 RepID=A0A9Q0U794_SALVM|nr:DNA-DIRECTED RNA polymerase I SUBUNIT 2 [Salix viminalis]